MDGRPGAECGSIRSRDVGGGSGGARDGNDVGWTAGMLAGRHAPPRSPAPTWPLCWPTKPPPHPPHPLQPRRATPTPTSPPSCCACGAGCCASSTPWSCEEERGGAGGRRACLVCAVPWLGQRSVVAPCWHSHQPSPLVAAAPSPRLPHPLCEPQAAQSAGPPHRVAGGRAACGGADGWVAGGDVAQALCCAVL